MSIVKESKVLRENLETRLKELYPSNSGDGFKQSEVIKDAAERNFKIAPSALSKYFKGVESGSLSEAQVKWLAVRYYIPINFYVGVPVVEEGRVTLKTPKYNELQALINLKKYTNG